MPSTTSPRAPFRIAGCSELERGDCNLISTARASSREVFPKAFLPTTQVKSEWRASSNLVKQRKSLTRNRLTTGCYLFKNSATEKCFSVVQGAQLTRS